MNRLKNIFAGLCLVPVILLGNAGAAQAQLNPLNSQYFLNQYLANPAMAGYQEGLNVNAGFRQQWSVMPGSPSTQALTADYRMNNKIALGLSVTNEAAGLLKNTRLMGTYAYHLPLNNEDQELHFGVSLGVMNQRIMYEDIDGDPDDVMVGRFNERETYMDGDFGVAYTNRRLNIQAALPNLKSFVGSDQNKVADLPTFYSALSYKWMLGGGSGTIEPKVAFRGVKGYHNIVDAGANLTLLNDQLIFSGMYHSSESATFGFGLNYQALLIHGMYTTQTTALRGYSNGDFEVGLKYRFLKKKL